MTTAVKTDLITLKEYFGMDAKQAMRELRVASGDPSPTLLSEDERAALAEGVRNGTLTY